MVTKATLLRSAYRPDDDAHALGEFSTYREAEQIVDRLSDAGFPVERVRIVGTGLHSVEHVMGRLSGVRAGLLGAALGAWLGMLTGLLMGAFIPGVAWLPMLLSGMLVGAAAGAALGWLTHWATDGRRDFVSTTHLQAERYAVEVGRSHAPEAVRALGGG